MLVNDKNVLNSLEVKEEIKELVVPITREEYSEYIMLRLMLAEAIDNMRMTDEGEAYMIYNVPKNVAENIMPREYQERFDDLVVAYEFKKNKGTEEA